MKKIITVIILCVCLATTNVNTAYATGASAVLEIVGGSLGAGGLETLAALGPYAVTIVTAACIAMGVNVVLTEQSKAAGMTKTDYMYNQIRDWCTATASTVGDFSNKILSGTTIGKDGTIYLDGTAAKTVSQFAEWAWDADKIIDNTTAQGEVVKFGDYTFPVVQTAEYTTSLSNINNPVTLTTDQPVALVLLQGGYLYAFNRVAGTHYQCKPKTGSSFQSTLADSANGYYYTGVYWNPTVGVGTLVPEVPTGSIDTFLRGLNGTFETQPDIIDEDYLSGDKDKYDRNKDVILPGIEGTIPGIGTGILDGLRAPGIDGVPGTGTIPVDGYLDGVKDLINDLPVEIPVTDEVTGVVDYPVIDDMVPEETITLDDYPSLPDNPDLPDVPNTPVIDFDIPFIATPTNIGELTLDLRNVFPFCLPFDAVDMVRKLNAEPVTPSYRIQYHVPIVNVDIDYTVSLQAFDGVASVLRKMELLLFCIGLAVATRAIFIRS